MLLLSPLATTAARTGNGEPILLNIIKVVKLARSGRYCAGDKGISGRAITISRAIYHQVSYDLATRRLDRCCRFQSEERHSRATSEKKEDKQGQTAATETGRDSWEYSHQFKTRWCERGTVTPVGVEVAENDERRRSERRCRDARIGQDQYGRCEAWRTKVQGDLRTQGESLSGVKFLGFTANEARVLQEL